jgi:UDP:flavonoid glycosyltransferase YjiC (YdhE family)
MDLLSVARLLAVLTTGIAAGAMAGHALLLGRFFDWMFESNRTEMFRQSYPVFIREKKPELLFDHLFTLALLVTNAYAVLLWRADRIDALALAAAGLQWFFVLIFFGSGFASLERELLVKGNVAPERVRRFLSLNARITVLSAILLAASLGCLVL